MPSFIHKRETTGRAVERVAAALIRRQLGPGDTLPVLLSDEVGQDEDFAAIVVEASPENPAVIDEGDVRKSTKKITLTATLRGMATADAQTASERMNDIEEALYSTDPVGIDLGRFLVFHVFSESEASDDTEADGRKTRARTFTIAVEEEALG
jgi:hypothetical protein